MDGIMVINQINLRVVVLGKRECYLKINYFLNKIFMCLHSCISCHPNGYIWGKWVGNVTLDNCTNPDQLFESIVLKAEDVIDHIFYAYFDGSKTTKFTLANDSIASIMSHVDSRMGRCFKFKPTDKMFTSGIRRIYLKLKIPSTIHFHSNGMFKTAREKITVKTSMNKEIEVNIDHEEYDLFDLGGRSCCNEPNFNRDLCTEARFERKVLEKFGCTTPYGTNKKKVELLYFHTTL